jgi:hypothetical protein
VLADSLAFHGPERPERADDPQLWPNVAPTALGGRAELVAGTGWTARHAWQALIDDPRTWAVLPDVDALVLGVGSMDTLPSPLPTAVRELIPLIRNDAARRLVRRGYLRALPALSRGMARLPTPSARRSPRSWRRRWDARDVPTRSNRVRRCRSPWSPTPPPTCPTGWRGSAGSGSSR